MSVRPPYQHHPGNAAAAGNGAGPRIGGRLKHHRLSRRLRLKDLARSANCSESLLSRIENNLANPSLATLHRLCQALDVTVASLLQEDDPHPCVVYRAGQRRVLGHAERPAGVEAEFLVPPADGRLLEATIITLYPEMEASGPYQHIGEEVGYVVAGELELTVDGHTYFLAPGDSFFFRSDLAHSYRNPGGTITRIVWINTPPTF